MEDVTGQSEQYFSNEKQVVVTCETCDTFIYATKAPGVDKIIVCGGCGAKFVLSDTGLRKVK